MSVQPSEKPAARIVLPDVPVIAVTARQAAWLSTDGEVEVMTLERAQTMAHKTPVMLCHAPYTCKRLGAEDILGFDVLELFAFVHPAKFCVPTPAGLARALGLPEPQSLEDMPIAVMEAAQALLGDLQREARHDKKCDPLEIAVVMGMQGKGWNWTPFVCEALGRPYEPTIPTIARTAFNAWKHLPEWSEGAPPPPPAQHAVTGEESRQRLKRMLDDASEARPQQMEYATEITTAFNPMNESQEPHLVLAEAGTGVGKTLGYLAPASVWAEKNDGPVWVSTFTRNLQRQIDQELNRLYPDAEMKSRKVAVRKGRENYMCLLNFEDEVAASALSVNPAQVIAAGIMTRWAGASRDGDLTGGDFPGWLAGLLGWQHTMMLADRRGECIFSACDHYHKCFVERAARKAKYADIVVANHALVMIQTALSGTDDDLPRRYVFDEGHHLFDAADSAFAGHLTARETSDMRRWIKGPEGGRKSRARGLKRRVEDLIAGDTDAEHELQGILHEASVLPAPGWSKRLKDQEPQGAAEEFFIHVYKQVHARADGANGPYSLETDTRPLMPELADAAQRLKTRLRELQKPMRNLANRLRKRLEDQADTLDSDTRRRLEAMASALTRRGDMNIGAWIDMLETLREQSLPSPLPKGGAGGGFMDRGTSSLTADTPTLPSPSGGGTIADERFVDWMQIERVDGKAADVGLYRHWVDPMQPFAAAIKPHAHGIAVTSATLRDASGDEEEDWGVAEQRTGAEFITRHPKMFSVKSPYDYAAQTKVFIVNDVRKDDLDQVASAYRVLFEAAGGGALGLFTSISRLRGVHERIAGRLELAGLPLYAQHVDEMDTGTLVDIFRDEIHTCLLGTDAVRDGVDVPGESLRLLVYDRVPWPRPTILHRNRRNAFGGKQYDERMTRLKLRQAYGRLVRRATDRGIFVMMDQMMPSRLHTAFPEGVAIVKTGLADIAGEIARFFETE